MSRNEEKERDKRETMKERERKRKKGNTEESNRLKPRAPLALPLGYFLLFFSSFLSLFSPCPSLYVHFLHQRKMEPVDLSACVICGSRCSVVGTFFRFGCEWSVRVVLLWPPRSCYCSYSSRNHVKAIRLCPVDGTTCEPNIAWHFAVERCKVSSTACLPPPLTLALSPMSQSLIFSLLFSFFLVCLFHQAVCSERCVHTHSKATEARRPYPR